MNKKISQFEVTSKFNEHDLLTVVQDNENKNITGAILNTSLSETFTTNERVDGIEQDVAILDGKVDSNYEDLSNQIVEGDQTVTKNVTGTMNEYYDVLNNTIITLERKHDADMSEVNGTVQEWIDDIDNRSTLDQLKDALNRLTVAENLITALADIIANGGGSGVTPGFHTQPTSTIFPLSGYYKTGNTDPLTTTDTLNQALGKLESKVDSLESSGGMMPVIKTGEYTRATDGNLYTAAKSREENISRLYNDSITGYLTFLNGVQWGQQFGPKKDFLGVGASMYKEGSKWNLDVDNLFVRGEMTVNELIVNEIKAVGGEILVTMADMKCSGVVEYSDYWRCYLPEDTTNQFRTLDQAICQKFDGKNVKRYWRLVINVGTDENGSFIDLSKYDKEESSNGIPESGDNIIQLGNRDDSSRQSAIKISAKGTNGPSITMYYDIVDYSLEGKEGTTIGRESTFVGTLIQRDYNGDLIRVPIDKGQYIPGNKYYYYDRVSYMGSLWLCMAQPWTEEAPNKDKPYVWQLQVEKGDAGNPASDVAKWVEITGEHLFFYDTPDFVGTPDPAQLTLDCNVYGIEDPSFEWKIKETNTVISNYKQCNITPELFGDNKYITLRCTVISGEDTFYDEQQVGKVGNGAQGEDAYYIDLSNSSMNVPFDAAGNNPLIDLSQIYTYVHVYRGKEERPITSIKSETVEGEGYVSISLSESKITLSSLTTRTARFRLTIEVDGQGFTKDLWVNQSNSGENGFDGADAAYVLLSGEQLFHYYKESPLEASPSTITLYATAYNIIEPVYSWWWCPIETEVWTQLENEYQPQITVDPNAIYFLKSREVKFKVICRYQNGDTEYSDIITVSKVYDGIDGTSPYTGRLTNESQSIPATYTGSVLQSDVNKIKTDFELLYGNDPVLNYTVRRIIPDSSNSSEVTPTSSTISNGLGNKTITLATMDPSKDMAVFKIEFVVDGNVVAVKDFTITKQKGGKPGDFDVLLYGYRSSQPPYRPSMGRINVPTSAGIYDSSNNMVWKLDIPSGSPIWMTKSTYTANEDGTVTSTVTDGYYWTLPVKVTGEKGDTGDKGDKGDKGEPGTNGVDGEVGQVQTYRGDWISGTYYYLDRYRADVVSVPTYSNGVITGRTYYRRIGGYTGTTMQPPNSYWWTSYGANFQSVATGLLFAVEADIAGWKFRNDYIYSQTGNMRLDGRSGQDVRLAIGEYAATSPGSARFRVHDLGQMFATGANIEGTITANSGKIGGFKITDRSIVKLDATTEDLASTASKFAISDSSNITNANYMIAFGGRNIFYVPGNSSIMYEGVGGIMKDIRSYNGKKTAFYMHCAGGSSRNTVIAAHGNMNITGDFARCGRPLGNRMPDSSTGFDRNGVLISSSGTYYLPTGENIMTWFGSNPNSGIDIDPKVGLDAQVYEVFVSVSQWTIGDVYISGNSSGNSDYTGINGTPLYGRGVERTSYGRIKLTAGDSAHFIKVGRQWFLMGKWN